VRERSPQAPHRKRPALGLLVLELVACSVPLAACLGAEWKAPREYRRQILCGGDADTVAFAFCDGGHIPSGSPLVVDEQGQALPFRVLAHRRGGETWIAYNAARAKGSAFVYYGARIPGDTPRPAGGSWEPRLSLLLHTMPCPGGALESHKPIQAAVRAGDFHGIGFVENIFHGINPFGPDSLFASYYVGYLKVEKPGKYRIYTASSEASYVFLDGKLLCEWPGHHDAGGGRQGQHGADITLNKGEYKIEYYHAKTQGETCMMLGWTPPGEQGWKVIPESAFVHTPVAKAGAVERRANAPLAAFSWVQEDQLLVDRKPDPRAGKLEFKGHAADPKEKEKEAKPEPVEIEQFTRVTFHTQCRNVPEKARVLWDYGDGSTGTGEGKEHIYVGDGPFTVVARIVGEDGKPLDTYGAIVTLSPALKNFTILDTDAVRRYVGIIVATDCTKYSERTMEALWELVETEEDAERIKPFTEAYANSFGVKGPKAWRAADRLALACSVKEPERAMKIYAALVPEAPTRLDAARAQMERLEILLHKLKQPERALEAARSILRTRSGLEERIAAVKIGDVYRTQGDFAKAEEAYRDAQKITYAEADRRTIAVRQGGFLETVWSHIENGALRAAREGLVLWEIEYPSGKLSGDLILMTARYFDKLGEPDRALAELETLVKLNPLTPYLPDVELLMARAHRKLGNTAKARELIEKVMREYPKSRAAQQAVRE